VSTRLSAGILLFRRRGDRLEVLLVHPGGPFFRGKDLGYWSIPKGEPDRAAEDLELAARREFEEETGQPVPAGPLIALGTITQRGGKVVHAWAVEGDLDPATMSSNAVEMKFPPLAGREIRFPEVDRWAYFDLPEAGRRIKEAQIPLLERLEAALAETSSEGPGPRQAGRA
jgi:predicted NUDIX family NTP pyrophosphohydrolase